MEVWTEKLEIAIGRAEEYRLLGRNNAECLKVHLECIKDLMKALVSSLKRGLPANEEGDRLLLADAIRTLKNLRSELADAKREEGGSIWKIRAKLEKQVGIKFRSFDGEVNFCGFISIFEDCVSPNTSLADVEKMIVLKSYLIGEPLLFVDALPTTARNYPLALKLLKDVYGFYQYIRVPELYKCMVALPPVSMNDGVKFQRMYGELERILQSMKELEVDVDNDRCLRFLYLQRFSEETSLAILLKEADMLLPEIRKEVLDMVCIRELHAESGQQSDHAWEVRLRDGRSTSNAGTIVCGMEARDDVTEKTTATANCSSIPKEKLVESPTNATDFGEKFVEPAAEKNVSTTSEQTYDESGDVISGESSSSKTSGGDGCYVCTLLTVCATISRTAEKKFSTTIRLMLGSIAPVSLMTASAAERLGIKSSDEPKTLRLRGTLGGRFTATEKYYTVLLQVNAEYTEYVEVHIVEENAMNFTADDITAVDVADFKKAHPHLAHLDLPDTGKGRRVELFLSEEYYNRFSTCFPRSEYPQISGDWRLQPTKFGWLVGQGFSHDKVKKDNNCRVICSYLLDNED